jgi:hypothetical protein
MRPPELVGRAGILEQARRRHRQLSRSGSLEEDEVRLADWMKKAIDVAAKSKGKRTRAAKR